MSRANIRIMSHEKGDFFAMKNSGELKTIFANSAKKIINLQKWLQNRFILKTICIPYPFDCDDKYHRMGEPNQVRSIPNISDFTESVSLISANNNFRRALFLSSDRVVFLFGERTVQIHCIHRDQIIYKLKTERLVWQLFQTKPNMLITRDGEIIRLWGFQCSQRVSESKTNEFIGNNKDGTILVLPTVENDERIFLCHNQFIQQVEMEEDHIYRGMLSTKVLNEYELPVWDDRIDSYVQTAAVHRNRVVICTARRMILFDMSSLEIIFQFEHTSFEFNIMSDEDCDDYISSRVNDQDMALSDQYFIYFDYHADRILCRDLRASGTVLESLDLGQLTFRTESPNPLRFVRFDGLSMERNIVCTNTLFSDGYRNWKVYMVFSVDSGNVLFHFSSPLGCFDPSPEKHVCQLRKEGLIIPAEKGVKIVPLPLHIIERAFGITNVGYITDYHTMKSAYLSCLSRSTNSPTYLCQHVISHSTCKNSIQELYFAHRIVMLTMQDISTNEASVMEDIKNTWFNRIYLCAKHLYTTDEHDQDVISSILKEARQYGLVESETADVALTGKGQPNVTPSTSIRTVSQLERDTFFEIVSLEPPPLTLQTVLEKFKKNKSMAALLSVTINLISLLACSFLRDITDIQLRPNELTIDETLNEYKEIIQNGETLEKKILRFAGNILDEQKLEKIGTAAREQLLFEIEEYNMNIDLVRNLIVNSLNDRLYHSYSPYACSSSSAMINDIGENRTEQTAPNQREYTPNLISQRNDPFRATENGPGVIQSSISFSFGHCVNNESTQYNEVSVNNDSSDLGSMSEWPLEKWKRFNLTKENIEALASRNIALLLAAFIVRFDDSKLDKFKHLAAILNEAFEQKGIDGLIVSDRTVLSDVNFSKLVMDYIRLNAKDLTVDQFLGPKIKLFRSKI